MKTEHQFPHFNFDFQRIRAYWVSELQGCAEARAYLRVVQKRLEYWIADLGAWIDFEAAEKHVREDLHMEDAASVLTWLSLKRRVRLGNQERRKLDPSAVQREPDAVSAEVRLSSDGLHDAVWHEDLRALYHKAILEERRLLRRLHDTAEMPERASDPCRTVGAESGSRTERRPHLQWMWASRLLAYLFECLKAKEAIYDDGALWAALDGVFVDRNGRPITRKDLALWAHQYHNNKCGDEAQGRPQKHESIDQVVAAIQGE
jgi:hypothetical protein